jgi:hypothetical protein
MFDQQLVRERRASLLAEAKQIHLARQRPEKEPLIRLRLTVEIQLGRRRLGTADR